ncbi:hypothetical protein AB1L88_12435 [Tautonia sp. JC769]|uniref:hypothetical protein n=1 Tax=Tautonia sp. JC769 TaxID=3232135 RepID=UPI003458447A
MRVWPLIAALSLAATGCAGLDLSGFDDEHLARLAENSAGRAPASHPIGQAAPDPTPQPAGSADPVEPSPRLFSPLPPPEPVAPLPPPEPPRPIEPATPAGPSPLIEVPRPAANPRPIAPPRPTEPAEPIPSPEPAEPIPSPGPAEPIPSPEPAEPIPSPEPAAPIAPPGPADTDQAATPAGPLEPRPAEEPPADPEPADPEPADPAPQPPATILASQATPIAPAEPRELALFDQVAGEVEAIARADAPTPLAPPEPAEPQGTVIATVGPHAITLPELTEAIKDRIARLPGRKRPTRRLVISMVQAEMEARILESLVLQQARVLLDAPGELDDLRDAIARQWSTAELPRILDREGFPSAEAFDARLRGEGQCLDDLRSAYTTRTLARELMRREGRTDPNIDAYLNDLRSRFPIQSDLAQARRALARN